MTHEWTVDDLLNLLQADETARARISVEDLVILKQVEKEKEEQERMLGRGLSDEESQEIDNAIPGADRALANWDEMYTVALKEVKRQSGNLQ